MAEVHSPSPEVIDTLNKANHVGFIDDFLKQLSNASVDGLTPEEKNHILTLRQTHKVDEKGFEKASIGYLTNLYGTEIIPSYGAFIAETLAIKHGFDKDVLIKYFSDHPENILNLSEIRPGKYSTVLFFGDKKITIQTQSQKEAQAQDQQEITSKAIQALEQEKLQLSREVMYDGALILGIATVANTAHNYVKDVWIKTNTGTDHIEFAEGEITGTKSSIKTRILYELTKHRGLFLNPADKIFHKSEHYLRAKEIKQKYAIGNLAEITYEDYKWMAEISGDTKTMSFEAFTQAQQNLVGHEQRLKADYQAYLRTTNSPISEIEFLTQKQYLDTVGKLGLGGATLNVLFLPYIFNPLRENGEDFTSIIQIAHDEAAFFVGGKAAYNVWEKIPLERGGILGKSVKGVGGILSFMGGGIAGMQIAPSSLEALGINLDKKAWKYMPDREGESGKKSVFGHIFTLGAINDLADKYDINIGVPGFEPLQLTKTDVDFATNPRIYLNNRISDITLWNDRIERFSQKAGLQIYNVYKKFQNKNISQQELSQEIVNILYNGIPPTQVEDILYLSNLITTLSFEGEKISQDDFTKFFHDTAQSKKLTPDNILKLQEKNDTQLAELYIKIMKLPENKHDFVKKIIERIIKEQPLLEANKVTFDSKTTYSGFGIQVEISEEKKFYNALIESTDGDLFVEILNQAVAYKRESIFLKNISYNGYAQNWTLLPKNKNMAENAENNIPALNESAGTNTEKNKITLETQERLNKELQGTEKRDFILKKMDETFAHFSSVFKEILTHDLVKPKIEQYNGLRKKVASCQSDAELKKVNSQVRKLLGDLKNAMLETPDLSWDEKLKLLGKVDQTKVTETQEQAGLSIVEIESILDQFDGISAEQIEANKKARLEAITQKKSQGSEKEEFEKILSGIGVPAAASGMIVGLASMMGFISDDPNKPSFFASVLEFFKDPFGNLGKIMKGESLITPKTTHQEVQTAQVKTTEKNSGVEEKKSKIETIGNIQKYHGDNFTLTIKNGKIDTIKSKSGVEYEANIQGILFESQSFPTALSIQVKEDGNHYITGDENRNEINLALIEEKFAQPNLGDKIDIMKGYTRGGKYLGEEKDLYFEQKSYFSTFFS